jgi:hypothetical protein
MFALVVFPAAVVFGHIEDVLALALVLLAISALLGERWTASGLLLGVAVGFKQWAVLGIPLLVALAPSGARARSLRASLLPPVALLAAPLIIDWRHASLALLRPRSFPQLGHAAPWVHHATVPTVGTMFRLGAVVIAVGLAFVIRERRDPAVVLAAFALAFLSRLAFEPVVFAYYLCPALALLFMHERARGWSGLRTVVLGAGWLAFFLLHPRPVLWWMGAIALAASLAWPAVADVWRAVRRPRVDAPRPDAVIQSEVGLQPVP